MAKKLIVERFLFVVIAFVGIILLIHTLLIKTFLDRFFQDYLRASCASGALLLAFLYILAKFNKKLEKQVSNFLYFKGKEHYKILLKEAITDGLTGLYDHKYFMMRLEEEASRAKRYLRPLSLLMIDIDYFKKYNDTFGHLEGDKVLEKLGTTLRKFSRNVDLAARYGGEEFAVILPETNAKGAMVLAERLRKYIEVAKTEPGKGFAISIGIGTFDPSPLEGNIGITRDELIKMADQALYKAKAGGRNRTELWQAAA
ncbi:MAG: GGDEF domain-containing protein [Candidatus Omnitrophica bacterium]|nr:GGDEF domain-containing protein [Candidatus Omnitrophota bacterium]